MTPPTPPPTTYDHKPAYEFAESMVQRLVSKGVTTDYFGPGLGNVRWALVEAYMAGRAAAMAEWQDEREEIQSINEDNALYDGGD